MFAQHLPGFSSRSSRDAYSLAPTPSAARAICGPQPSKKLLPLAGAEEASAGSRTKKIEDIEVGDLVWAWDEIAGKLVKRPVKRLFRHKAKPILAVTIADDEGRTQVIEATTEHPFWIEGSGWVAASKLRSGDILKRIEAGNTMRVVSATCAGRNADVFNFEVGDVHNYFVGSMGVLVHNESVHPGRAAAYYSEEVSQPSIVRTLREHYRRTGDDAAAAAAKLISSGKVDFVVQSRGGVERGGAKGSHLVFDDGSNNLIRVFGDTNRSIVSAAGTALHESVHEMQERFRGPNGPVGKSNRPYTALDELEAMRAQAALDPSHEMHGYSSEAKYLATLQARYAADVAAHAEKLSRPGGDEAPTLRPGESRSDAAEVDASFDLTLSGSPRTMREHDLYRFGRRGNAYTLVDEFDGVAVSKLMTHMRFETAELPTLGVGGHGSSAGTSFHSRPDLINPKFAPLLERRWGSTSKSQRAIVQDLTDSASLTSYLDARRTASQGGAPVIDLWCFSSATYDIPRLHPKGLFNPPLVPPVDVVQPLLLRAMGAPTVVIR